MVRYVINTGHRWRLPWLARHLFRTPFAAVQFAVMTGGARRDTGPATQRFVIDFDATGHRVHASMEKDPGPFPFGGGELVRRRPPALHPDDVLPIDLDQAHPGTRITAHLNDGTAVTGTVYLDPRAGGPDTLQVMVVIPRADIDYCEAP